jgi:hypothetical protein
MLEISHLVVIGCSFSYGDGLANPKEDSWSAILSKKLDVPIVNLSSRGGGNDRIMRRLYEYHYLNSSNNNNPFYILAFSHSSRREEFIKTANDYMVGHGIISNGDYMVVSMKNDPGLMKREPFSAPSVLNYDPFISARKKLMVRSYIQDFLALHNINYLTTDFMPDTEDELQSLHELYPAAYERIYSDKFRLRDLREFSIKYPRLPCGHDDVEAQLEIGNYVYDELIARHGEPAVKLQDFTTLRQYVDHYHTVGASGDLDWL